MSDGGPAPASHPPVSLGVELMQLSEAFGSRSATLREIMGRLARRAYELLMVLCVLPFLLPVSVPGMSTPFGLAVAIVALQLAFGRLPWLPRRLLDRELPPGFLTKVLGVTARVMRLLEKALRPQWLAVTGARWLVAVHFLAIAAAGLVLALPMPIPLTNTFPAWTILLLTMGLLERDGLFVLAGYGMALATIAWFAFLGAAVRETLAATWSWIVR